jgi:hypothetical protein
MNVIDQMNEPYDYGSILHYGPYAFSANGKRTIVAKKGNSQKMGQRIQFSDIDLRKINRLYQCSSPGSSLQPVNSGNVISSSPTNRPQVNRNSLFVGRQTYYTRMRPINTGRRWPTYG